jgi:hypothetical protein
VLAKQQLAVPNPSMWCWSNIELDSDTANPLLSNGAYNTLNARL